MHSNSIRIMEYLWPINLKIGTDLWPRLSEDSKKWAPENYLFDQLLNIACIVDGLITGTAL